MSCTDYLRLGEHKIFKNVRETLPKDAGKKAKSLMAVRDDFLYVWNHQDNCVLALNIKAARSRDGDAIIHQTLLPVSPPLFTPERLIVNDSNTLLIAFGTNGLLVFELPPITPPFGTFHNNKEMIYCRSHSLQERTLAFSPKIEVRQVRFHPGSPQDNHVCMLTNDNLFRVFALENSKVRLHGVYRVGPPVTGKMVCTQMSIQEAFGETAEDFDFAPPESIFASNNQHQKQNNQQNIKNQQNNQQYNNQQNKQQNSQQNKQQNNQQREHKNEKQNVSMKRSDLKWPAYFLTGDGMISIARVDLNNEEMNFNANANANNMSNTLKFSEDSVCGPFAIDPLPGNNYHNDFCSILVIPSTPVVLAVATLKGKLYHVIVLDDFPEDVLDVQEQQENIVTKDSEQTEIFMKKDNRKQFLVVESLELELSFDSNVLALDSTCPMYLHRDDAKLGNYFTTHDGGVHSICIDFVDTLHEFLNTRGPQEEDILQELNNAQSTIEYLLCTKTNQTEIDAIIGFSIYHNPHSFLALLGSGQLITLAIVTMLLPSTQDYYSLTNDDNTDGLETMSSPLKKMLTNPFDAQIQRILKPGGGGNQPILKLPKDGPKKGQQECYDMLQRAAAVFRGEHFAQHERAREEIQKRVKALLMLKEFQRKEIENMMREKQAVQETTERLAEKYEDLKDKQEELSKRCENLMITISKQQGVPTNAEKTYHETLKRLESKMEKYKVAISKLGKKAKYQETQMDNWKVQSNKNMALGSQQTENIKSTLQEMTRKISGLVKEVNEYKTQLNL